jgi:hypothetical protein
MTAPVEYNITLYQGSTYRETFTWETGDPPTAVNLTGCTARMQVRASVNSPVKLLDLTTENGGITLGGSAGTIQVLVAPSATAGQPWRTGVYDLEVIFVGGDVRRLLAGAVELVPEVTRV